MITPPYLQKGDTIAMVATARKNIEDNLQPAISWLKNWGFEVVIGNTIGLDKDQLAGTDEQRAADFQTQLDNPNIKAIWCVRGGYGTVRMIDLLDFTKFKESLNGLLVLVCYRFTQSFEHHGISIYSRNYAC